MAVNFKGGFTVLDKKGEYEGNMDRWKNRKGEVRYKSWRKNVFQLNKGKKGLQKYYVCEKCNKRLKTTRALHAHHIKSWFKFPKDRYDRNNGVVLCWKCHNAFHKKYKFEALAKPELLDEYLKAKTPKKIIVVKKPEKVEKMGAGEKTVHRWVGKVKKLNKRKQKKETKKASRASKKK